MEAGWLGTTSSQGAGANGYIGQAATSTAYPRTSFSGTGGGGGGGSQWARVEGANAGSGKVIIKYAGTKTLASGGTVVVNGGNTYHVFDSSGTFQIL